uniref:Putative salicylic acid-binding protein 2 n=1 Tax=Davidia involucrata TaxID=16924 RepID=A0A5B6YY58_DAVIN
MEQKHFVLVHGLCHGAWCWYKLKLLIELAGHRVTALDLSASGINLKTLDEVRTLYDYTLPLLEFMASLPSNEKVILVGHSLGGMSLALTMDKYPEKVSVAVFLAAFLPDTAHKPSYVLDYFWESATAESWMDTQISTYGSPNEPLTSILLGPKFMATNLYQLCPPEDLELATLLVRAGSLFREDLAKEKKFSDEGYGSVTRVYVAFNEDKSMTEALWSWMLANFPVEELKKIEGADHMGMMTKPQETCQCLLEIAQKYT